MNDSNVVEFPYDRIRNPLVDPKEDEPTDVTVIDDFKEKRELENDNP